LRREAGAADAAAASPWAAGLLFAVLLGVLLLSAALSRRAVSAPPGTINGPQSGLAPSDRRIVITLELIVFEHQLPRNRLLPGGMRANDLKELFVFIMPEWILRFSQSVLARANRTPKVIITLGFSFARIRDTSCLS
jgi:hypothetical protein